jgi:hypothetical protein
MSTKAQARLAGLFASRRWTGKMPATASMMNLAGSTQSLSAGGHLGLQRVLRLSARPAEPEGASLLLLLAAAESESAWLTARVTETSMKASMEHARDLCTGERVRLFAGCGRCASA